MKVFGLNFGFLGLWIGIVGICVFCMGILLWDLSFELILLLFLNNLVLLFKVKIYVF